ncbi:MAG: cyclic nucleotide-binding domain-containing protein, partial [Alphaproteobacteria bacterium]|nr:cyclic nucleotide-binding domain-containing protein [Alphaproteobacteria bacterium]
MQTKEYQAGDVIYRPGESSDFAFVLKSGAVELKRGPAGSEKKVAEVKIGDMFGEYGVIENDARAEMAVATAATTVEMLNRDDFAKLYEE